MGSRAKKNAVAQCIRERSNWSKISEHHKLDSPKFNPDQFKDDLPIASPKLLTLLQTIQRLDDEDKKTHGHTFKHFIYSDLKTAYGAKLIASALAASGFHHAYGLGKGARGRSFVLNAPKRDAFATLTTAQFFQKPLGINFRKDILKRFNARPENIHGENLRLVILDSGLREGVDLFDVKYVHLFEPILTQGDQKQAVGRATRFCGQKGLQFHNGWPLHVYRYDTSGLLELFMEHSNLDLKKLALAQTLEEVVIDAAVDRTLTTAFGYRNRLSNTQEGGGSQYQPSAQDLRAKRIAEARRLAAEAARAPFVKQREAKQEAERQRLREKLARLAEIRRQAEAEAERQRRELRKAEAEAERQRREAELRRLSAEVKRAAESAERHRLSAEAREQKRAAESAERHRLSAELRKAEAESQRREAELRKAEAEARRLEAEARRIAEEQRRVAELRKAEERERQRAAESAERHRLSAELRKAEAERQRAAESAERHRLSAELRKAEAERQRAAEEERQKSKIPPAPPTTVEAMDAYVQRNFPNDHWPPITLENGCAPKAGDDTTPPFEFSPTQNFIRHYLTPQSPHHGLLAFHSVGTGKTCLAIATATTHFEPAGWTILYITKTTLKGDVWKNMFDQVCSLVLQGKPIPTDKAARMRMLSKSWSQIQPLSYRQFSNMLRGKNALAGKLRSINGAKDPLQKTLVVIDEAHKLFVSDLPPSEKCDIDAVKKAFQHSYQTSGADAVKLLLMTGTPYTDDPLDMIKLLNLFLDPSRQLPEDFAAFAAAYLDDAGHFTATGRESFMNHIAGLVSYLNRENDRRTFSYPIFTDLSVPPAPIEYGELQATFDAHATHLAALEKTFAALESGEAGVAAKAALDDCLKTEAVVKKCKKDAEKDYETPLRAAATGCDMETYRRVLQEKQRAVLKCLEMGPDDCTPFKERVAALQGTKKTLMKTAEADLKAARKHHRALKKDLQDHIDRDRSQQGAIRECLEK